MINSYRSRFFGKSGIASDQAVQHLRLAGSGVYHILVVMGERSEGVVYVERGDTRVKIEDPIGKDDAQHVDPPKAPPAATDDNRAHLRLRRACTR